jgi:RNA polymerase sigma-70 factor (ECF subfamily)
MAGDQRPGGVTFDDVYADHFEFVWRCLRTLGTPAGVLDDAAQDVFVIVHRQLPGFRGESSLPTWLFGIVRNVASNHRRGVGRKQAPLVPLTEDPVHAGPGPVEHAQDREAAAFVQGFMAALDDDRRALFLLAVLEEMAIPEVAGALEIPLNTAYTRLRRLRAEFARALAKRETAA